MSIKGKLSNVSLLNFALNLYILSSVTFCDCSLLNSPVETEFVQSIVNQTTKYGPHPGMSDNTVYFYLDLYQLMDINEKEGAVVMQLWVFLNYYLPHLAWDRNTSGITRIMLPQQTVWLPDVVFFDVVETIHYSEGDQSIDANGAVIARSANLLLKFTCPIKVYHFPFDTQICRMNIGQWISSDEFYYLGVDPAYFSEHILPLENFNQHGQWHLETPVRFRLRNRTFDRRPGENYNMIEYEFVLKRQPVFYVYIILVPAVLLGFMSLLSFFLHIESGEKISLGLTILLSQIVELLVLSDILPPSSNDNFPAIGRYVVVIIILVALSVLVSVTVTGIYNNPPKRNPPILIVRAMQSGLMHALLLEKLKYESDDKTACGQGNKIVPKVAQKDSSFPLTSKENAVGTEERSPKETSQTNSTKIEDSKTSNDAYLDPFSNEHLWKTAAVLIDRLAFILYFFGLVCSSLFFLISTRS